MKLLVIDTSGPVCGTAVMDEGKVYSVTDIGVDAFHHNSLTSITIPSSITSIGGDAFFCCELTSVNISDLSAWCKISFGPVTMGSGGNDVWFVTGSSPCCNGANLYLNGELLTDVVIPNNITNISNCLFAGCNSIISIEIPESVTKIGKAAFCNCINLVDIIIPDTISVIDFASFANCTSLNEIIIPDSVTTIGGHAFYGCSNLVNITIPNSVTNIYDHAFNYCNNLKSITISDSVTNIGGYTFLNCSRLTDIYYTGTTAEWNRISFGDYWKSDSRTITVHCSDGEITV